MRVTDLLPQMVLVGGVAAAVVISLFTDHRRQWLIAPLAISALLISAATQILGQPQMAMLSFEGQWTLDTLTTWGTVIIAGATGLTVALSPTWMRTDRRHGEYYAILLLAALGAQVMAAAADVMELIVGILLSSVTGYVLASYHRRSPLSAEAGVKFFLIGGLTNSLLLVGAVLLFTVTGTTLYRDMPAPLATADPTLLVAAVARFVDVLPADQVGWRPLVAVLAAATMTLGNLAAFWQDDLRRLLGWSSGSQSGYGIMAAVAIGASPLAVPARLTFALAYALANMAAFGVVVALRGSTDLEDYTGLARSRPWLAAGLAVAMLSLVGIPPLIGFTAKLQLFTATIDAGYAWLAVVAVINTVASLFYYLRVIGPAYLADTQAKPATLGPWSAATVALSAAGVVTAGLLAGPILQTFAEG